MVNNKEGTFTEKMQKRDITVGVCRLGLVAAEKAKAGFKTIGFDVQEEKAKMSNEGHNYIGDVVNEDLKELVE